jgi:signal transduction histidine kinase
MSLVTRLSAFFLSALALVLVVFSILLGALAAKYMRHRLDQRLSNALDSLEAAMHVEPDGLQWKPHERWLTLGLDDSMESVRWGIVTPEGRLLDKSANYPGSRFPATWSPRAWPAGPEPTVYADLHSWRLASRRLLAADMQGRGRKNANEQDEPSDIEEFTELILTAGLSPAAVQASMHQLESALAGLSLVVWLVCAVVGRIYCRKALTPVSRLASAARDMPASDSKARLPAPDSRDELQQLTVAFNGLLDRLHASSDRQRRFASDASHQLRTPISGILSLIEVVRRRQRPAGEYEETLDRIHQEAAHMRQIVESLLLLAREDSNTMTCQTEAIDLTIWLPQQLLRWRSHPRSGDFVQQHANESPVQIRAQCVLLSQLFDNILDNACNYSENGTPVVVSIWSDANMAGFAITDEGPGISDEDLPRIFEPFYRTSNALGSSRTGAGLGLAIVQKIAASFGGRIEVSADGRRGSRFAALFPVEARLIQGEKTRPGPCNSSTCRRDRRSPARG